MDEANKLVLELQQKLCELDLKVLSYRKDMNDEFFKYQQDLLKNVSNDISKKVFTIIGESLKSYKALYPNDFNFDSCATGNNSSTGIISTRSSTNSDSNSLSLPHVNGFSNHHMEESQLSTNTLNNSPRSPSIPNDKKNQEEKLQLQQQQVEERPRSPHEREKEFTGVFTPSYLPLLDSSNRYNHQSKINTTMSPTEDTLKDKQLEILQVDASTDTRSLTASPDLRKMPVPIRKNTDEMSIASDVSSDGHVRRSALRRSSSYNKGSSPRRVRFDFEGEEVLPTASPKETSIDSNIPLSAFGDDSDDEAGSQQVEDIDAPPPKRISSSQALRALSRGPLEDDGTQWTTVSAPPDGSASVATSTTQHSTKEDDSDITPKTSPSREENTRPITLSTKIPQTNQHSQVKHVEYSTNDDVDGDDVLSEDDMLDMPPLRQMRSQNIPPASILSPARKENDEPASSPLMMKSPTKPFTFETVETEARGEADGNLTFSEDDDDDLFHFDENTDRGAPPLEEEDEEEVSDAEIQEVESHNYDEALNSLGLAKSPPRTIVHPNRNPTTPTQASATMSKGVVGSYKGRPFGMPVASDEIHAHAAELGNMNSFVGSVNGRSGLDESDVLSFRASGGVGSWSGTPKSMTERMMMDDLLEADEREKGEQGRP